MTATSLNVRHLRKLEAIAAEARQLVIKTAASPTGCHLGGSLSVVDILVAAHEVAAASAASRVILSKGHAAAGLYAVLHAMGVLDEDPSVSYGRQGSKLTGHPNTSVPGISFPTGSLGHGIAYAVGWALACRLRQVDGVAIAVVGDGELQEGLTWEVCQVAAAQGLANLIVVVDHNGGQNDGFVADISPMDNIATRFEAFGFEALSVDGHSISDLYRHISRACASAKSPTVIVAATVKAKGIAALEGGSASHYVTARADQAAQWLEELS